MSVKDWCDEKLLAKKFIATHGLKYKYEDVLQQVKYSLNILSMKQKFLNKYCKSIIDCFKSENVANSFKDTYNKELEELEIQQLKSSSRKRYRNALAVTVQEHDNYHQEISTSATSVINKSHTAQEATNSTPEDSNTALETTGFAPKVSHTAQEIAEATDFSTTLSIFRTQVFKAGYKYFKKQLSLSDVVNLGEMTGNMSPESTEEWSDNLSYSILKSETKNETDLALKIINMIGGFTMSVFEEYFKKYDGQKWEQAKEAKPSIGIGMAEKMIDIYDLIAQKANEGYHEIRRCICIEKLNAFDQGPESEVIQMLSILENIVEGLIEEEREIKERSEIGFYRPVVMIMGVLFRKSQFEMKE
ncbi:hypothetical protein CU098_008052 [Rhizopus stolonifer]|uniref:Uncharacterized protein n=1 Tax=Rhizopus stolonifer TaxID=4846 RepID=A0A367JJ85_RHIST|nr:hypothetical protein CU098_008052 [Rhizopus stolonifer]